jgi:anti-sigma-K factor RskA
MTDGELDGLAAEYVLGSLDAAERQAVDARRAFEPELDAGILEWERRLAPLSDRLPGVEPPAGLFGKILSQIDGRPGAAIVRPSFQARSRPRFLAAGISALAASLLLVLAWLVAGPSTQPAMLAAELHMAAASGTADEANGPAFAVLVDARTLTIRPSSIKPSSGRSYVLWLTSPQGGVPTALGEISPSRETTLPWPASRPLGEFIGSRLAISLEPAGAALNATPAGRIVFEGRLTVRKP